MNALIAFRSNTMGNLLPNSTQRESASETVSTNFRKRMEGILKTAQAAKSSSTSSATSAAKAAKSDEVEEVVNDELGKDDFLQLLVLEMQNQDPMEPMDNSEMIAQLAQFSSLEQMENLNSTMEFLVGNVDQLNFISAQGLLGKYVEGINDDNEIVAGTVDSVTLNGSIVVLDVEGATLPMTGVIGVADEVPVDVTESDDDASESAS